MGNSPARKKARDDAAEQRRTQVGQLIKAGLSQREMARALNVGATTIHKDLTILRRRWREEYLESIDEHLVVDLARLDDIIKALTNSVRQGELPAIDRYLKVLERRARILGYDAPTQIQGELTGKGGKPIEASLTLQNVESMINDLGKYGGVIERILASRRPDSEGLAHVQPVDSARTN